MDEIPICELEESSDSRGLSFSVLAAQLDEIGAARDIHIGEIRPGCIRGNHYHARRGELIAVVYTDRWSVHWDTGPETEIRSKTFAGAGAVSIAPPNNWSHAIRNDGKNSMWIVAVSDRAYDRHAVDEFERDAIRRVVAR